MVRLLLQKIQKCQENLKLVHLIMLLYFDRRRAALTVALFFLLANSGITLYYIIRFAPSFMGAGYASATLLSSIFAIFLL